MSLSWGRPDLAYVDKIGQGAFGIVYKSKGLIDQKLYGVKQISVEKFKRHQKFHETNIYSETWQDKLKEEVRILSDLNNEFILRYYHCWFHGPNAQRYYEIKYKNSQTEDDSFTSLCLSDSSFSSIDYFYIQMEFCELDLGKWLRQNISVKLRDPHKLRILRQILKGLEYIHSKGIIHRDIKPGNIMIKTDETNIFQIKIGDFGLSKLVLSNRDNSPCLSVITTKVGTPTYMSPEMESATGQNDYDFKTDIYSAGLVFYEVFNSLLVDKLKRQVVFINIRNGLYDFTKEHATKGEDREIAFVKRITKLDKNRRPTAQKALELLDQLLCEIDLDTTAISQHFKVDKSFSSKNIEQSDPHDYDAKSNIKKSMIKALNLSGHEAKCDLSGPLFYGVSTFSAFFTGRDQELKKLHFYFSFNKKNLVLITGIAGIGKTELSRKFASEISNPMTSCVWLHGETQNSLQKSISTLARNLKISNEANDYFSKIFDDVLKLILQNSTQLIVIIDNVDACYNELTKLLRKLRIYKDVFIIVTSRNKLVLESCGETIDLDVLTAFEAKCMVHKSVEKSRESEVESLCELVQNYPLALAQAVAYVREQKADFTTPHYSISHYMKEFSTKYSQVANQIFNHNIPFVVTWEVSFTKIYQCYENALAVLQVLALLEPESIEIQFLKEACCWYQVKDSEFFNILSMLEMYCLAKINKSKISIHRLVQEAIRQKINDKELYKIGFDSVLIAWIKRKKVYNDYNHVETAFKVAFDKESPTFQFSKSYEILLQLLEVERTECAAEYAKLKCKNVSFVGLNRTELTEKLALFLAVTSQNMSRIINAYDIDNGNYNISRTVLYKPVLLLSLSKKYFGDDCLLTIQIKNKLLGEFQKQEMYSDCLMLCEEIFNSEQDLEIRVAYELLKEIRNDGKFLLESKVLLERVLRNKKVKHRLQPERTNLIKTMLAETLENVGELKNALELYEEICYALQGSYKYHPDTMPLKHRIAQIKFTILDINEMSCDEIEKEFGDLDYESAEFTLEILKKVHLSFQDVLGNGSKLTEKVNSSITRITSTNFSQS